MKAKQQTARQDGLVQALSGLWLPNQYQPQPSPRNRQSWTEKVLAGKTLWDWMSLLLVPLLVGIGTIVVTAQQTDAQNALSQQLHNLDQRQHASDQSIAEQQHTSDQNIAQQARYDGLLKNYRDGIDTLLLTSGLRTAPLGSDVRRIAHSRTLDVLRQVDASRKGAVVTYLADLGLVQGGYFDTTAKWHIVVPAISLYRADLLNADLTITDLRGADLTGANLYRATPRGANLTNVNLTNVNLRGADLYRADLLNANLTNTDLRGANLTRANLTRAKNTTPSQLAAAASLSDTTMPDGTKHP